MNSRQIRKRAAERHNAALAERKKRIPLLSGRTKISAFIACAIAMAIKK